MRIALMAHIPDNLISRSIKDIMESES